MEAIPLFPLGTVTFPGVMLPLHIFEPRYRQLMRRLMDAPEGPGREFGVVAVRQGWSGPESLDGMYDIGCTAELRQVQAYPDGTLDIVAAGRRRFRLIELDGASAPYLHAHVEWLPESPEPESEAQVLARSVAEVFGHYLRLLAAGSRTVGVPRSLPHDPLTLSHLVAASAPLAHDDRQELLAETSTTGRLRLELRLLKREAAMLSRLKAVPVPLAELRVPQALN